MRNLSVFLAIRLLAIGCFLFSANSSAASEKNRLHSRLIPPKHENTRGVNVPFPLVQFSDYTVFSSRSRFVCVLKKGLAVCPLIQNPLADTSALASSEVIDVVCEKSSAVSGVSVGSTVTFEHISFNTSAVKSVISLCLMMVKPPLAHEKAC